MAEKFSTASLLKPITEDKTEKTTADILQTQYDNLSARLGAVGAPVDDRGPIGRFLNLEQDQGFIMDVFEIIDRPGQAVKGFIAPEEGADPITGFFQGLAGQTDRTGLEVLEQTGALTEAQIENMDGFQQFAVNVGFDIFTDPLTYIPAGTIGKVLNKLNPFEIERTLPRMVSKIDEVAKSKKALWENLTDPTEIANAKKQAGLIDITDLDDRIAKNQEGLQSLRKKIDDLRGKGLSDDQIRKKLSAGETELLALDDFTKKFEQAANDLKIAEGKYKIARKGGSAPTKNDIEIFMDVDGEFYSIASVEVKQAGKGFARGRSVKLAKGASANVIDFGSNVKLTETSRKILQDNYSNVMITVGKGKTATRMSVAEAVNGLITGAEAGKKGSINLFKKGMVSAEDIAKIEEAAREVLRASDWDYMYIVARDGTADLVHFKDIVDKIDVKASFRASEAGQKAGEAAKQIQARMFIDLGLDTVATTPSAYDDMFNAAFGIDPTKATSFVDEKIKVKVGILEWMEHNDIFKPEVQRVRQVVDNVKRAFNAFFDLDDSVASQIRRMSAESQIMLDREGSRLIAIQEEALRRSPNANKILKELTNLNAKIVNGKVVIPASNLNLGNIFTVFRDDYLKAGQGVNIPIYGARPGNIARTADNAIFKVNETVRKVTGMDDAFKLVEKDGLYFLELDQLSPEEFKHLMGKTDFQTAINQTDIRLGTKKLDDEYYQFYEQNPDIVDLYRQTQSDIIDMLRDELGIENLPDVIKTSEGYTRKILSEKGREYLKANQPLARSKYVKDSVDYLQNRKYFGTDEDINKMMKFINDVDFDFFDPNLTNSIADLLRVGVTKNENGEVLRIILNGSNRTGTPLFQVIDNAADATLGPGYQYITSFNDEFSKMYSNLSIPDQKVFTDYLSKMGFKEGKAIAIHKTAFDTLKRVEKSFVEVPELLKGYDNLVRQWKGLNLITPSFHLNSGIGNTINMYLAGMGVIEQGNYLPKSVMDLNEYKRILTSVNDGIVSGLSRDEVLRNLSVADKEMYDRLLRYFQSGASMKGRGTLDIGAIKKTLEEGGQKNLYDKLLAANFDLAENIDEVQRYALFQWAYDKELAQLKRAGGLSDQALSLKAATAAEHKVMESLFDYSHFTRFEQDVMKRIIPFYTFMKNNLIFQMRNIIRNPQQYGKLGRAYKYYVSDIAGITNEDMPEYARNNLWLPLPMNVNRNDKQTITFLKANLPPGEFGELIESRGARLVSSLTVPLKLPIELALNRDVFTGAEIKEFPGQKDRMAPDTGVASFLRDEQGMAALSGDPTIQKIASDLGFRVPARYITTALGIMDTTAGYKDPEDAFAEALNSLGVLSIRETEDIKVTNLYQALEKYRQAEKRWEQEMGIDLPSKRELGLP